MPDKFYYLLSVLVFAGIPASLEFVFGFHIIKKYFAKLAKILVIMVILTPVWDGFAFAWKAWVFNPEKNLGIVIAGDVSETYIFTFLVVCTISFATLVWSNYEDRGLPVIHTSIKDVLSGKYALWRKKK